MSRLIDADKLNKSIEDEFCEVCVYDESGSTVIYDFEEIVNRQPVIDAVPVVRCKDCEYSESPKNGRPRFCNYLYTSVRDDLFCWKGERRTHGTD